MFSLLVTAIPTTIAIGQGVSAQKREQSRKDDTALLRPFTLTCLCTDDDADEDAREALHGNRVVLRDGKLYLATPSSSLFKPFHPFQGFYITYPDPDRPSPLPLGLVSTISDDPPALNWIYVDQATREVRYANRTGSKGGWVGSWGWGDECGGKGGKENKSRGEEGVMERKSDGVLRFESQEEFVGVEDAGGWELLWGGKGERGVRGDAVGLNGRRAVKIRLLRAFVEGEKKEGGEEEKDQDKTQAEKKVSEKKDDEGKGKG